MTEHVKKKEYRNFACRMDVAVFGKLDEYCRLSGQSKTYVAERAIRKYVDDNFEKVRELNRDYEN